LRNPQKPKRRGDPGKESASRSFSRIRKKRSLEIRFGRRGEKMRKTGRGDPSRVWRDHHYLKTKKKGTGVK
jgi:hypothetical protein